MMKLLAQLKRRQMFRIAAAYAVVAWLLLQLFNNLAPILELPAWIGRAFVLLLAIGLPVTLFFAWMRELPPANAATDVKTNKLDWILAGGLAAVIAIFAFQQFVPNGAPTAQQQPGVEAAKTAAASPTTGISLAVLPFDNLSGDPSQEFFSDGMTEEITSALARVPDLRVVARTSAYQFRAQNREIQSIGRLLNATHFLEGSVRKAGDRVRITAQLIDASDGTHVWTDTFDRELTDVFAIQEDIAKAIAGALRVPLGLGIASLVPNQMKDLDSYQQYLRARTAIRTRDQGPITEAAALLEQVTARDPDYAPAWAILALAYVLTPSDLTSDSGDVAALRQGAAVSLPKAEAAARRAIQLDPNLAAGYMALGRVEVARGKWASAEELYQKSLELDPYDSDGLTLYGNVLAAVGRLKEALEVKQKGLTLEPFVPAFSITAADVMWLNGQNESAVALLKSLPPGISAAAQNLAKIYASMGRYSEAADNLRSVSPRAYLPGTVEQATRLMRSAPAVVESAQSVQRLGTLSFVFLHVGAPERALEPNEARIEGGYAVAIPIGNLWHPSYAPMRKTERFKAFVRKAGLVDYWKERGWPDVCKPVGANDFACE